jgi:hypothetical protein
MSAFIRRWFLAHDAGHEREHAVLTQIGTRDLVNAVLEVELAGSIAICREYSYPFP